MDSEIAKKGNQSKLMYPFFIKMLYSILWEINETCTCY